MPHSRSGRAAKHGPDLRSSPQAITGLLLPVAIDRRGQWRTATEVPRGLACDCRCPSCNRPVIARHGESRRPHFAHHTRTPHLSNCNETTLHRLCKAIIRDSVGKCMQLPRTDGHNVRLVSVEAEVNIEAAARRVDLLANVSLESPKNKIAAATRQLAIEICVSNKKDLAYCLDMKKAGIPTVEIVVTWQQVFNRMTKVHTQARIESALRFLLLSMTAGKRWLHRKDMSICRYCQRYELPGHKTNGVACELMPCPTCDGVMRKDSQYDTCRRCGQQGRTSSRDTT